ncbi:MAG TPA: hypothetical protein ENH82_19890 [bacterium]|nr:hypothetical protein [bacterium]
MKSKNYKMSRMFVTFLVVCFSLSFTVNTKETKSVLIIYHGGIPPWKPAPSLDDGKVDALTHATTKNVNVENVGKKVKSYLENQGFHVEMKKALDMKEPIEFLVYDGIIFGTPTWFSNVAYPIKRIFDEHMIRIYEHRVGRLNDKALSGYTTVMERGESGHNCLRSLINGLKHLSENTVQGTVINTGDEPPIVEKLVEEFCERFIEAINKE